VTIIATKVLKYEGFISYTSFILPMLCYSGGTLIVQVVCMIS